MPVLPARLGNRSSRLLRTASRTVGGLVYSALFSAPKQSFRICSTKALAVSFLPEQPHQFGEPQSLSAVQSLPCVVWLRLWPESYGLRGFILPISSSTV